jgi:hypothetical protein
MRFEVLMVVKMLMLMFWAVTLSPHGVTTRKINIDKLIVVNVTEGSD